MQPTLRVSVRDLVAVQWFSPDITPAGSLTEMLAGTKAHRARESEQAGQFDIERSIRADVTLNDECVTVFGRMDAFLDGDPPVVEEIKLCRHIPDAPLPEHQAQARLYAALWALEYGVPAVDVRVVYVNDAGEPVRVFSELAEQAFLLDTLFSLLNLWLSFALPERERALRRDESLRALPFPFPQYRAGQRELAVQVYTAITRKKRLFASLPTGTGKSAAVLYPALKALGEGKTRKILYLTARTTARQSPLNALERMRAQGAVLRVATVLAKEKLCPAPARCHPDDCPRAKGHFLRQPDAVRELLALDAIWTDEVIRTAADAHRLCPFELALTLTDLADVVLLDVNYAFDPFAQIVRLFRQGKNYTLLIDEAHHLLDRVRDSLSGSLSTHELRVWRAALGKALGRKHAFYGLQTDLIRALEAVDLRPPADAGAQAEPPYASEPSGLSEPNVADEAFRGLSGSAEKAPPSGAALEVRLTAPPEAVTQAAEALLEGAFALLGTRLPSADCRQTAGQMIRRLAPFVFATEHFSDRYAVLAEAHGRECSLELYCLSPAETIASVTRGLRGAVFFSATLSPLEAMRSLLGGDEEDACFSLPSPFPTERLAVVRRRIQTRYAFREASAARVAQSIAEAADARPGKYIAYFPSYAYLGLVLAHLMTLPVPPLSVQENDMSEDARNRFLEGFTQADGPRLGLCVLGGLFSEGVDLPGERLIGAMIVGVGLPTPTQRLKTLQAYYGERFGDGFLYAWMIPAMQKVAQAAGRVIRTERDRGLILLLDDRYYDARYTRLLPPDWRLTDENLQAAASALDRLEDP